MSTLSTNTVSKSETHLSSLSGQDGITPPTPPSITVSEDFDTAHGIAVKSQEISDDSDSESEERTPKRARFKKFKNKTKNQAKELFFADGVSRSTHDEKNLDQDTSPTIDQDPAFNPHHLRAHSPTQTPMSMARVKKKTRNAAKGAVSAVIHPKDTLTRSIKRTTAGKMSSVSRPFLSLEANQDFLNAHNDLLRAESSQSSRQPSDLETDDDEVQRYRSKLERLESRRERLRVAYITSRHIDRVRVVSRRHLEFPRREKFFERNSRGEVVRFRWERYLGYLLLYHCQDFSSQYVDDFDALPFDIETLSRIVERVAMVSAPWQAFMLSVRAVYRWEDPRRTAKWLSLYCILFYTDHIVGFIYAYIIYITLRNKFYPDNVKSLREKMDRAMDRRSKATHWGELVEKYGREKWLEPMLDELGPYLQLQLGDLANLLEAFANFYTWRSPKSTAATLFFFAVCLLISLLADMKFCVKILFYLIGGYFFACWPIASRYPKYRYLVNPVKWVFWDIPTNAELSFESLRNNAQTRLKEMTESTKLQAATSSRLEEGDECDSDGESWHSADTSKSVISPTDIASLRAHAQDALGRLIISTEGIRFVRSFPRKELWGHPYTDLKEMRKLRDSRVSKLTKSAIEQIEFEFKDGTIEKIQGTRDRDQVFNTVLGFSGLRWQALQLGTTVDKQKGNSNMLKSTERA